MAQPSTEPITELILQDVEAALAGIVTTGTTAYWHDIMYVKRVDAGYPTLPGYPALVVMLVENETLDELQTQEHSLNVESLHIRVDGWMRQATDVAKWMQRMARDIRTALMQEPRRSTLTGTRLAIHTFINAVRYVYAKDLANPLSLVEVDVMVHYRTDPTALETAQ